MRRGEPAGTGGAAPALAPVRDGRRAQAGEVQQGARERVLDAAERLFAERGVAATSVRAITAAAGTNVAAVHYHFGSKWGLLREVVRRRIEPINRERLERLARIEAEAGRHPPTVESIVAALVAPAFEAPLRREFLRRLPALLDQEPQQEVQALGRELFAELAERFTGALARALPQHDPATLRRRLQFLVGAMVHVLTHPVGVGSPRRAPRGEPEARTLADLITFGTAGLRAPAPVPARRRARSGRARSLTRKKR